MQNYKSVIKEFFDRNKIEYFGTVDYNELREINPKLRERVGFVPRSATVFLIPYFVSVPKNLSAYASSYDYHIFVREITDELSATLKENFPEYNFKGFGDHSPIDERHGAVIAGLGVAGKNTLTINEKYGSYVFIATMLSDMPAELSGVEPPKPLRECMGCGKCLNACPTGILRSECDLCLSAITQRKGELSDSEISLMRKFDTVWGCDVCQRVCPHNRTVEKTPISFFEKSRVDTLTKDFVDSLSDEEFSRRAFSWRGKKTILRNLEYLKY